MIKFITIAFLFVICWAETSRAYQKIHEVQIDESKIVMLSLPRALTVLTDSTVCYIDFGDKFYVVNIRTGKIANTIDIHDIVNVKKLGKDLLSTDTSDEDYDHVVREWKKNGKNDITIESVCKYNDSLLLIVADISFPVCTQFDTNRIYTEIKKPFYLLITISDWTLDKLNLFSLKWEPEKGHFESPIFGIGVTEDKIYIANTAFPDYKGNILTTFEKATFKYKSKPAIKHIPYKLDMPYAQYFPVLQWKGKHLVSSNGIIYNIETAAKIFDVNDVIKNIHSIKFFIPYKSDENKYFLYLLEKYNEDSQSFPPRIAVVDIRSRKIIESAPTLYAIFCSDANKVIAIEKRETGYFLITYKM